jgi:SAM-dependent methyltransferase
MMNVIGRLREALRLPRREERVYRAPPITESHVAAIRLIAPHFDYPPDARYHDDWEKDQNANCWREFRVLQPLTDTLAKPRRILEIGPGLGRSLVFFAKKLDWRDCELHAYEGEGSATKYTKLGPRFEDSFCGNFAALRAALAYNGIDDVIIHDAKQIRLRALPGPFDLIYSFYSIGFHWSLEHFLDDILALLDDDGTGVFIVPAGFTALPHPKPLHQRLLPLNPAERKANRRNSLLVLRKKPFPLQADEPRA